MYPGYDPIRQTIDRTQYTELISTLHHLITSRILLLLNVESALPETIDDERLTFYALVNAFDVICN